MKRLIPIFIAVLSGVCLASGQELPKDDAATPFIAPQTYPIERYEGGWSKNPFTLKTAPVIVEGKSFAKDLALAGISGDTANPTVTIVNIKTHERYRLRKDQPAKNGMVLAGLTKGETRKDSVVQLSLGSETSEIRYDSNYLRQVASTSNGATAPGAPTTSGKIPIPPTRPGIVPPAARTIPPQQTGAPQPATAATRLTSPGVPAASQGRSYPPAVAAGSPLVNLPGGPAVPLSTPTDVAIDSDVTLGINPSVVSGNLAVSTGQPQNTGALGVSSGSPTPATSSPLPERRRMITLPVNLGTAPP